jgi:hypothetical protein
MVSLYYWTFLFFNAYLLTTVLGSPWTFFVVSSYFKYMLTLVLPAFLVIYRKDSFFTGPMVKFISMLQVISMTHFIYYLVFICGSNFELAMTGLWDSNASYTLSMFPQKEWQDPVGVYEQDVKQKSKIDFNASLSISVGFWGGVAMYKKEFMRCVRARHFSTISGHFGALTFTVFGFLHVSNPDYTSTELTRYLLTGTADPNPVYIPTYENINSSRIKANILFKGYMSGQKCIVYRLPSPLSSTE